MSGQVIVHNVRHPVPEGFTPVYVGRRSSYRPQYGENFSELGNPYTMPRYTREDAIGAYDDWLRLRQKVQQLDVVGVAELVDVLISRVQAGENIALCCWCAPLPCHADIIKATLEAPQDA